MTPDLATPEKQHMPATLEAPRDLSRATRPLYLKHVPTPIWERIHVNAIHSGMRLSEYLIAVFTNAEPIVGRAEKSTDQERSLVETSSASS